jgi:dCMP deaminase
MNRDGTWWRSWFLGMADYVATASKDPSTKVGAVIVDEHRVIRGIGYNGFPRGVRDSDARLNDRAVKYKYVVHAEANAILNCSGSRGCTLIATMHPCSACATLIIQAGIAAVFCRPPIARWSEDAALAAAMLVEAGVNLIVEELP